MNDNFFQCYIDSTKSIIREMTGIELEFVEMKDSNQEFYSRGVASIINFAGKIKGRVIVDLDKELAFQMVENIICDKISSIKDQNLFDMIQEVNNTIAGDANTKINNEFKMGLRLAPPMSFSSPGFYIAGYRLTGKDIIFKSELGSIMVNIGFEGEY